MNPHTNAGSTWQPIRQPARTTIWSLLYLSQAVAEIDLMPMVILGLFFSMDPGEL